MMDSIKGLGNIMSVCSTAIGNFAVAATSEFEGELVRTSILTGLDIDTLRLRVYKIHGGSVQTYSVILGDVVDEALRDLAND